MSEENVELVRLRYEAIARDGAAAVLSIYDSEVGADFSESPFGELAGVQSDRGHEGMRRSSRDWNGATSDRWTG